MSQRLDTWSWAHLAHELRNDAVKGGALVAEALLTGAEGPEVLGSFRNHVRMELQEENDPVRIGTSESLNLTKSLEKRLSSFMISTRRNRS